jgi:hypothetical protein
LLPSRNDYGRRAGLVGIRVRFDDGSEKVTRDAGEDDCGILLGFFSDSLERVSGNDGT